MYEALLACSQGRLEEMNLFSLLHLCLAIHSITAEWIVMKLVSVEFY